MKTLLKLSLLMSVMIFSLNASQAANNDEDDDSRLPKPQTDSIADPRTETWQNAVTLYMSPLRGRIGAPGRNLDFTDVFLAETPLTSPSGDFFSLLIHPDDFFGPRINALPSTQSTGSVLEILADLFLIARIHDQVEEDRDQEGSVDVGMGAVPHEKILSSGLVSLDALEEVVKLLTQMTVAIEPSSPAVFVTADHVSPLDGDPNTFFNIEEVD